MRSFSVLACDEDVNAALVTSSAGEGTNLHLNGQGVIFRGANPGPNFPQYSSSDSPVCVGLLGQLVKMGLVTLCSM